MEKPDSRELSAAVSLMMNVVRLHGISSNAMMYAALLIAINEGSDLDWVTFRKLTKRLWERSDLNEQMFHEIIMELSNNTFKEDLKTFCASHGQSVPDTLFVLLELAFDRGRKVPVDDAEDMLIQAVRSVANSVRSHGNLN